eukprot:3414048-Pyramimonas_sp.AAC.1
MAVVDEDPRNSPGLAKAAVLAELSRWVEYNSITRRPKKGAWNLPASRFASTWKSQNYGTRHMKCRLTAHGFKDLERGHLDKFS